MVPFLPDGQLPPDRNYIKYNLFQNCLFFHWNIMLKILVLTAVHFCSSLMSVLSLKAHCRFTLTEDMTLKKVK